MIKNVGNKIKKDVQVAFIFVVIILGLCGIGIIIAAYNMWDNIGAGMLIASVFVGVGVVIAWHSTFILYAYGQITENSDIIAENTDMILEKLEAFSGNEEGKKDIIDTPVKNENENKQVKRFETENTELNYCPNCGELQAANKNYCEICGCKIK